MKKIVICTGANGGIGYQYCREMLRHDYHVVLACRSLESGRNVQLKLKEEFPDQSTEVMIVDMGNLNSIQKFAEEYSAKYNRLDVLAHNAGVYFFDKKRRLSKDRIELNLAIHLIGPFTLTARLFPLLKQTSGAKIVMMSSSEHRGNPIDVKNLQMEKDFSSLGNMKAYSRSKWASLAFVFELQKRIQTNNLDMHALAAHPGVSITGIQHAGNPNFIQKGLIWMIGKLFASKPEDAAKPLVLASMEGVGGEFYGPTGFKEFSGKAGIVDPDPQTKNTRIGLSLWQAVEELSGLSFTF